MRFIPLQAGTVQLMWEPPMATVVVCDLVTGKVLHRERVAVVKGPLVITVPPDLVLTEWRIQ